MPDEDNQIIISFILDKYGSISNEKIEKGVNPIIDEAILSALKDLPDYKPIYHNNIPITAKFVLPFIFQ